MTLWVENYCFLAKGKVGRGIVYDFLGFNLAA